MAYTNIDDPSAYFQIAIYAGNNSFPRTITNDGNSDMQPDWVWVKQRTTSTNHFLYDSSRTFNANGELASNDGAIEGAFNNNLYGYLSGATSDGFTITEGSTNGDDFNQSSRNYVAWQWKANGGTTASNSVGDIDSVVQANTDAGFAIVTYTGNGSANQTIGHGLGAVPKMILFKNRSNAAYWYVYHVATGNDTMTYLNLTNAAQSLSSQFSTPTTTTFNVSNENSTFSGYNTSGNTYVAYVFADIQGYSKCGSYIGNASANGPFIYTGFKPAWVMIKTLSTADDWYIFDNKRAGFNPEVFRLRANTTGTETTGTNNTVDHLSNGFKLRFTGGSINGSGSTYIYMAFAENPFTTSTGIPATAR